MEKIQSFYKKRLLIEKTLKGNKKYSKVPWYLKVADNKNYDNFKIGDSYDFVIVDEEKVILQIREDGGIEILGYIKDFV